MTDFVSIIIPNYNGSSTIERCLEAALASRYSKFEVIVVDDCSDDNSVELIKQFPCELIQLNAHCGASKARNIGAMQSQGDILFFTDADCLLKEDTLTIASEALRSAGPEVVLGGTYTRIPADNTFFSLFQSVFIHYSETKRAASPDYIATHAMIVDAKVFHDRSKFTEYFLPILEDVEFSHRLRRHGYTLVINPEIQVRHIFNFSLLGSLANALRKSMYWTIYSIKNRDLLKDSGTASVELKTNVMSYFFTAMVLLACYLTQNLALLFIAGFIMGINLLLNRRLLQAFYSSGGSLFSLGATLYYLIIYPLPVGLGALAGSVKYINNTPKFGTNL